MKMIVFCLLIFSFNAFSSDEIGKIIMLKGEAQIHQAKDVMKAVTLDMPVFEKDSIETKEKSIVKIKLNDNTIINLGPESKTTIEKFATGPRVNVIQFIKGQIRIKYNEKAKSDADHMELKVPNAALGIRGTDIISSTELVKESLESVNVLVEGNVQVATQGITTPLKMVPGDGFSSASKAIYKINPTELAELSKNTDQLIKNDFIKKYQMPNIEKPTQLPNEAAKGAANTTETASTTGTSSASTASTQATSAVAQTVGATGAAAGVATEVGTVAGGAASGAAASGALEVSSSALSVVGKAMVAPATNAAAAVNTVANIETKEKISETVADAIKLLIGKGIKISDDIKEAMENREKMKKDNKCYYFIYHKVEVSGLEYHTRKTRGCNEYDNEID